MGEGGDSNGKYAKGSEQEYVHDQLKSGFPNMVNDSWDGKEYDVTNPKAEMFTDIQQDTKMENHIVNAGIFAAMVGQGQEPEELAKLADEKTIEYLKSKGVKDPMNPDDEDTETMYKLTFPQDYDLPETDLSKVTDSYNRGRQKNLVRKMNDYEKKGYKVVSLAGNTHAEELSGKV
jgi:hypothetical protein